MNQLTKDERELLSKPGDVIAETLEHLKMTQSELADRMGKTPSKVNDIIAGKEPITMNTALQLEKVLGIDANFWMNREIIYREKLARIEEAEQMEASMEWLKLQPYKQLCESGYIKSSIVGADMMAEMLGFYGVASINQWSSLYVTKYTSTQFRKSSAHQVKLGAVAAWLRIGEIEKQKMQLPDFDKALFKEILQEIKIVVRKHPEDFAEQLRDKCSKAGVAIVYTPMLPNIPASGAVRWVGGNPVIQLTDRHKTNDQFWFAFFHEAGHVLLHGKKEIFIENFEGYVTDEAQEDEANIFASNHLLPSSFIDMLPAIITEEVIRNIARIYQTHPGIVLGRLQRIGKVKHTFCKNLKATISLDAFTSPDKRSDM